MLKKLKGRVKSFRRLTNHQVQFELVDQPGVIHLSLATPWALSIGDEVEVAGETESASGQFLGYCYLNLTKGVHGVASERGAWVWVLATVLFCWAIFPFFTHLPVGIRNIKFNQKRAEALRMLGP